MRQKQIAEDCESVLKEMNVFDVNRYFNSLRMKGYEVKPRHDKKGKLVGYTIGKNTSVFKASAIGRKFMVSKFEGSWAKLYPAPKETEKKAETTTITRHTRQPKPANPFGQSQTNTQPNVKQKPMPEYSSYKINTGEKGFKWVDIPDTLKDIFFNEAQVPEDNDTAKMEDVTHVAMLLFAGYIEVPHHCPFLVEVVAVPLLNPAGAKRMMKMTECLHEDV